MAKATPVLLQYSLALPQILALSLLLLIVQPLVVVVVVVAVVVGGAQIISNLKGTPHGCVLSPLLFLTDLLATFSIS